MYTVKTCVSFEAAHRLYGVDTYSKECRDNLHGHSFKCFIDLGRQELNKSGMVVDFKLFKKIVNETVTEKYDHSVIVRDSDPLAKPLAENCKKVNVVSFEPTAEHLARYIFYALKSAFGEIDEEVRVLQVSIQETENNIASYTEIQ